MIRIEASLFPVSTKSFAGHCNPIGTATNNSAVTTTANTRSARLHFFQSATKSRIVLPLRQPAVLDVVVESPVEAPIA
jgi:hypothetical protein